MVNISVMRMISVWTINTLNEEAESELVQPLLDEGCQKFLYIKKFTLEIKKKSSRQSLMMRLCRIRSFLPAADI